MKNNKREMDAKYPGVRQLDCIEFIPRVDDLLELDDADWDAEMARHMQECPPCQTLLEQLQDLRKVLRSNRQAPLTSEHPTIIELIEAAKERY